MTDTPPDVEARMRALFSLRSGSDRVRMASDMFDCARALIVADIKSRDPDITSRELRVRVFERTYAAELAADDVAAVVARLRAASAPSVQAL